jgi:hypothetical protein
MQFDHVIDDMRNGVDRSSRAGITPGLAICQEFRTTAGTLPRYPPLAARASHPTEAWPHRPAEYMEHPHVCQVDLLAT